MANCPSEFVAMTNGIDCVPCDERALYSLMKQLLQADRWTASLISDTVNLEIAGKAGSKQSIAFSRYDRSISCGMKPTLVFACEAGGSTARSRRHLAPVEAVRDDAAFHCVACTSNDAPTVCLRQSLKSGRPETTRKNHESWSPDCLPIQYDSSRRAACQNLLLKSDQSFLDVDQALKSSGTTRRHR
jgi:hypothetical protein